jgi:hypothetical protein
MRTRLALGAIAAVVAISWLVVASEDQPPIPTDGLPLAMDGLSCPAGETGAYIHWIRGSGFPTPEAALGAGVGGPHIGTFDASEFAKRYVRLGSGAQGTLGAEFTLTSVTGDPSALAVATWSEDGWLVDSFSRCLDVPGGSVPG